MMRFLLLSMLIFLASCKKYEPSSVESPALHQKHMSDGFLESKLWGEGSCDQVRTIFAEKYTKKVNEIMENWPAEAPVFMPHPGCGDVIARPAPGAAENTGSPNFTGTNNQEYGVEEADHIKTDGQYFYVLNDDYETSTVSILRIENDGQLNEVSTISLEGSWDSILVVGNHLVVFGQHYDALGHHSYKMLTKIKAYDLGEDKIYPTFVKDYYFTGSLAAARAIKNQIYFADYASLLVGDVWYWPQLPDNYYEKTREEQEAIWLLVKAEARRHNEEVLATYDFLTLLPTQLVRVGDTFIQFLVTEADCARILANPASAMDSIVSINRLDVAKDETYQTFVASQYSNFYASTDQILISSSKWRWSSDDQEAGTEIHRFKLEEAGPKYSGTIEVPGQIDDSFSMSEYEGYLRVATTSGTWEKPKNNLFILGEKDGIFQTLSSIEDIAPGERIWSARFTKDKGFLVTFERVDPLFTLDLSDPYHPRVAGELKVPGVSTYLQDIGNNQLLAIGYGGDEEGLNWHTTVSLFDITDFANPVLAQSTGFELTNSNGEALDFVSSSANYDHLAINYFAKTGLTAIPLSASRMWYEPIENGDHEEDGDEGEDEEDEAPQPPVRWHYESVSKLQVVNTKPGEPLTLLGEVDHTPYYTTSEDGYYRYNGQITRSYFVGDFLYAFSDKIVTATRIADMATIGAYNWGNN